MKASARSLLLAAFCLLAAPGLCLAQRQDEGPPPKFEGAGLPEPPRQRAPWTPPQTKLPEALVSATRTLFEQGLADPRGGEYREVEFVTGSVWGDAGKLKTRAWVLPAADGEARRFAVTWGGHVTPVVNVGAPADLRRDVAEVIKADEEMRAKYAEENRGRRFPFSRSGSVVSDSFSASHKSLLPLKVCLLLRLGEAGPAEQLWAAYAVGVEKEGFGNLGDPYPRLAMDWVYALFDRAVCAHMRGDDRLTLVSARSLVPLRERVSAELERRRAFWPAGYNTPDHLNYYLSWLAPLDQLLADQERRVGEGRKAAASSSKPKGEVEALVAELDEVAARQWGQPGGVSLGEDPRVRAVVELGDEAVGPLLRALETDERLTRSVSFGRSFHPGRHLITVAETAYSALTRILKTNAFGGPVQYTSPPSPEGRRQLAARIRGYLEKYGRGEAEEERWYAVLRDDAAGADAWTQVAANILNTYDYKGAPAAWAFTNAPVPSERAAKGMTLRGEPLRGKGSPSVSQLFARRMLGLAERKDEVHPHRDLIAANNFALALLAWDGREQLPAVRSFQNVLRGRYEGAGANDSQNRSYLRSLLVGLYLKRFEVEDADAPGEYAEWLGALTPAEAGEHLVYLFTPMWRYEHHPDVAAAAARMFDTAGSPWLPLIDGEDRRSFHRAELLGTPMLNVKSFRDRVLEGLADRTVVGSLRPRRTSNGDRYELTVENTYTAVLTGSANGSTATFQVRAGDARAPRALESLSVRVCDVYASRLVGLTGAPGFQVYWTEAERDRAVAEMAAFLRNHGGRFRTLSGSY
ncbi:MAG TPA: hypothetical protein VN282_26330 [Pyrinomonadaceae bacterium]|nr:hypothetical protein [Pyrinomonadaceae bacterium]